MEAIVYTVVVLLFKAFVLVVAAAAFKNLAAFAVELFKS